ncbi:hypothetical protein HaLaN_31899, partial [Haematococcus lacustris]
VNFVSVRTELFFFELQELVIEFNQDLAFYIDTGPGLG